LHVYRFSTSAALFFSLQTSLPGLSQVVRVPAKVTVVFSDMTVYELALVCQCFRSMLSMQSCCVVIVSFVSTYWGDWLWMRSAFVASVMPKSSCQLP